MTTVSILGGGPAGAAAALNALKFGARTEIAEKSRFPRHKVCGEFLSPEIVPLLDSLGIELAAARPAPIRRLLLQFPKARKLAALPEPAWGLSRYRFDQLLLGAAEARGATVVHDAVSPPVVLASGRRSVAPRGRRLFGFKAHFLGPGSDAVELYFFGRCYVGINPVEDGITNVCGLGPEEELRRIGFDFDCLVQTFGPLRDRLRPLTRTMDWMSVGPLVFENRLRAAAPDAVYRCGDALSFIDPFTGSGLLNAVAGGSLAGAAAARGTPVPEYLAQSRRSFERPLEFASLFRKVVASGWAERLAIAVPASWLFRLTRPRSF